MNEKCLMVFKSLSILTILFLSANLAAFAQETPTSSTPYYIIETKILEDGTVLENSIINGPPEPPPGHDIERMSVSLPEPNLAAGVNVLTVPTFNWSHGCSATSAAMIAGYYDRNGYPDMYTGPTNGGVMPLDNSAWPDWVDGCDPPQTRHNTPLSATKMGLDGRITRGHVDDYWVCYNSPDDDPFVGNWTEHSYGDSTGDYMKTNQTTNYGNVDGATSFFGYNAPSATPLTCAELEVFGTGYYDFDGTYGLKLFYESRGYTVDQCYKQNIDTVAPGGFSFQQYMAEIDAGRPVMFHVTGHTMVGVGYDSATNLMYIHDTWDWSVHTMIWGGSYSGMAMNSVTVVTLTAPSSVENELAVDFGAIGKGLYHYDGSWTKLTSWDAENNLANFGGSPAAEFVGKGLWSYGGSAWAKLTAWDVDDSGLGGWIGGLAADFGDIGKGLHNYDGSWTKLTNWNVEKNLAGWHGNLAAEFTGKGLYTWDGSAWTKLTSWDVDDNGLAGWSDGLAADFSGIGKGLYNYDHSGWSKLTSWNAESLTGWPGGLAADFEGKGLYTYDGAAWTKISNWDADGVAGVAGGLIVDFGTIGKGLYLYDGTTWTKLTAWNADDMSDCDLN